MSIYLLLSDTFCFRNYEPLGKETFPDLYIIINITVNNYYSIS
jgi:hypothetical protein